MKPIRAAVMAALIALTGAAAAQVATVKELKYPQLRTVKMPQPKRVQLANGMVIFLQEDHELPRIQGALNIRGGARDVAADKAGLAPIFAQVWRTGGTESKTGDELDDLLARRAALVETGADDDSAFLGFDLLAADMDRVLPIVVDLLRKPAFREDKLALVKGQMNAGISRRNDNAEQIALREASRLVYGADSPYARQPEYATVASITRDDLVAFHKRFIHPNNMILGIVGDFDTAAMEAKLRAAFESWPRGPQASVPDAPLRPSKPGVYVVDKTDVTQSLIYFVHPGTKRDNPDYAALMVLNEVYGGGFSGRLLNKLRTEMGLAYAAGGGVGTQWDRQGVFTTMMGTKSETTHQAIGALRKEMVDMIERPATAQELALAKDAILNSFVFRNDSPKKLLEQRMALEFYGYPANFDDAYRAAVEKVTVADVTRVAKQYMKPQDVAILVVGNTKHFEKPVGSYGTVTAVDITIPEPGVPKTAAAPFGDNSAAPLIDKLATYLGGQAAIDSLQSVRMTMAIDAVTPQGPMKLAGVQTTVFPDRVRTDFTSPGTFSIVFTPEAAFIAGPMGAQDLPGSERASIASDLKTDMIALVKNAKKVGYTFSNAGRETIGGVDAVIVDVNAAGDAVKLWIDPATGRLLRRSSEARAAGELQTKVTEYEEWKTFGPLRMPVKMVTTANGKPSATTVVSNVEVNPVVDAGLFRK